MPTVRIPYHYRDAFLPFHLRTQRDAVLVCHRRAGKTVALCNELQLRCLGLTDLSGRPHAPPRFAFFYPTRVRAKDIAWPYLKYYAKNIPGHRVIESELAIEYANGGRVTLYGADNSRGVGLWLDGVVYDECDDIPQKAIGDIEPTLMDYGGWSVFAGMLRGRHNLWKRYEANRGKPGWFTLLMRASESGIYPDHELVRLREKMGEAAFEMQLECNPNASIANSIYGKQMDELRRLNRIAPQTIEKGVPLFFFADIGHSLTGDDWSWWGIQLIGRDILVHKYFACTGEPPAYYAAKILAYEAATGIRVTGVYLPHDGSRKDRQGRSAVDDLEAAGLSGRVRVVPRTPNIWDSINDLRVLMPRMYFDSVGCGEAWTLGEMEMPSGIDCLDFYTKKIEAQTGLIREEPVHNQYSHGADALRTFSEAYTSRLLEGTSEYAHAGKVASITISREHMPERVRLGAKRLTITR
jgi:phage terminase large subunit